MDIKELKRVLTNYQNKIDEFKDKLKLESRKLNEKKN